MSAYIAVLLTGGWSWDTTPDAALLAQASGAYFLTVVTTQTVNAFLCRSSTLTIGRLGLTTNRLLLAGVTIEFVAAMLMLLLPVVGDVLGHSSPTPIGWMIALSAPIVLVLVDAADKAVRRRRYGLVEPSAVGGVDTTAGGLSP
jgi:MFS-type transporter involved in bile tolerance (Atg22 family)